jgi:hypothetical protein
VSVTRSLGRLRTPNSFAPVARTMSTLSAKLTTLEKSCSAANSRRWLSGQGCRDTRCGRRGAGRDSSW